MTSFFILAIAFIITVILKAFDINNKYVKAIVGIAHVAFLVLCIIALVLHFSKLSFRGYLTSKLIFTGLIATGMILFGFGDYTNKFFKSYFVLYFILPLLMLTGIFFKPLRFLATLSGAGIMLDKEHTRYPIDEVYSLQVRRSALTEKPMYSLIEKKNEYVEKFTPNVLPNLGLPKLVNVQKLNGDSAFIRIESSEILYRRLDTIIALKR